MRLSGILGLNTSPFSNGIASALGGVGDLVSGLKGMMGTLVAVSTGVLGVGAAFSGLKRAVFEAATIEDFQTSFVTLLGSTDAAMERLTDLARFAAATPFELSEIAQASRTLETLTRGALSTGDGLRLVGNVAAATQQPFRDLAVVIGRLYDGLQTGRSVGEAMMRLQDLGVISGEVRSRIEALQAAGASGDSVWQVASESFARFSGEMDRRSQTLNGRISTLSDAWKGFQRELGGPLLGLARDEVSKFTKGLEEMTTLLRDAKSYWADVFGIAQGRGLGGMETLKGLIERARAMETLADREKLVLEVEREMERFNERAAAAPSLDFSPAITQAQRLLSYIRELPSEFFKMTEAQRSASAALAGIEMKRPALEKDIDGAVRGMKDERDRGILRDQNADPLERQISAIMIAQRATEGLLTAPPQNLEEAKERLELEMELVEQMSRHPEMLELASEKAKGLAAAYREIMGLIGQVNSVVGESLRQSVASAIEDIYGSLEENSRLANLSRSLADFSNDRLARIGGFIGETGGPSADYARRSAVANERAASEMQRLNANFEHFQSSEQAASWS